MTGNLKKKLISILLTAVMTVNLVPVGVYAEETQEDYAGNLPAAEFEEILFEEINTEPDSVEESGHIYVEPEESDETAVPAGETEENAVEDENSEPEDLLQEPDFETGDLFFLFETNEELAVFIKEIYADNGLAGLIELLEEAMLYDEISVQRLRVVFETDEELEQLLSDMQNFFPEEFEHVQQIFDTVSLDDETFGAIVEKYGRKAVAASEAGEENAYEEDPEGVPMEFTQVIDNTEIRVSADPGVFPEGTVMNAIKIELDEIDGAVDEVRDEGKNVGLRYTFDISFTCNGIEVEPDTEKGNVRVTFALTEKINSNLDVDVYHVDDNLNAEEIESWLTADGDACGASTEVEILAESFSVYVVEFTYGDMSYEMPGDTIAYLSDILTALGFEKTEVDSAYTSNEELVSVERLIDEDGSAGDWIVLALQPFETQEFLKVVIDGIEYEIRVTDDQIEFASFTTIKNKYKSRSVLLGSEDSGKVIVYSVTDNNNNLESYNQKFSFGAQGNDNDNAINIRSGAKVVLVLEDGAKIGAYGADGLSGKRTGGGAGINIPSNSTLIITGNGTVYAYGGNGTAPTDARSGDSGHLSKGDSYYYGGSGGYGGNGGAGSGAGIGGRGGSGGAGGNGGVYYHSSEDGKTVKDSYTDTWITASNCSRSAGDNGGQDGKRGEPGGNGGSMGTLYVCGKVTVQAEAGSVPQRSETLMGGLDGSEGGTANDSGSGWSNNYGAGGGGGGGGGGMGYRNYGIGGGGAGGGGGGGGASGGTVWRALGNGFSYIWGGSGGSGGSKTQNGSGNRAKTDGHGFSNGIGNGGAGGQAGEIGDNGRIYRTQYVDLASSSKDDSSTQSIDNPPDVLKYTFSFKQICDGSSAKCTLDDYTITYYFGEENPGSVSIPARDDGKVFDGYYATVKGYSIKYYDEKGNYVGPLLHAGNQIVTLEARWRSRTEDIVAYVTYINDSGEPEEPHRFDDIHEAFNYATGSGTPSEVTVTLAQDLIITKPIEVNTHYDTLSADQQNKPLKTVTLNLTDPETGISHSLEGAGSLDVINSMYGDKPHAIIHTDKLAKMTIAGPGTISHTGAGYVACVVAETAMDIISGVEIEGRSTSGNGCALLVFTEENVAVNVGPSVILRGEDTRGAVGGCGVIVRTGTLNVNGAEITGTSKNTQSANRFGIYLGLSNAKCNISGGIISGDTSGIYVTGGAQLNVTGGSICGLGYYADTDKGYGIENAGGTVTISGDNTVITGYTNAVNTTDSPDIPRYYGSTAISGGMFKNNARKDETGPDTTSSLDGRSATKASGGLYGTMVDKANIADGYACFKLSTLGRDNVSGEYGTYYYVISSCIKDAIAGVDSEYNAQPQAGYRFSDESEDAEYTVTSEVYYKRNSAGVYEEIGPEKPVDAGKYKVAVLAGKTKGGISGDINDETFFEISKSTVTVSPKEGQYKYVGEADPEFEYDVGGLYDGVALEGKLTREKGEQAGNYSYSLSGLCIPAAQEKNYKAPVLENDETFEIRLKAVKDDLVPPKANNRTYNGESDFLVSKGYNKASDLRGEYIYRLEPDGTDQKYRTLKASDAGTYDVFFRYNGRGGYADCPDDGSFEMVTVTISKASSWISKDAKAIDGIVYDGTSHVLVTAAEGTWAENDGGSGHVEYYVTTLPGTAPTGDEESGWSTQLPAGTEPGKYYVFYVYRGDSNHNDSPIQLVTPVIAKKQSRSLESITATDITFGQRLSESELSSGTQGGTISFKNPGKILTAGEHVETVVYQPEDSAHYAPEEYEVKVAVNKLEAVLSWSGETYDYDGKEHCPTAAVTNAVEGYPCTVTVAGAGIDPGKYTASAILCSDGNYKLPDAATHDFAIREDVWPGIYATDVLAKYDGNNQYSIEMHNTDKLPSSAYFEFVSNAYKYNGSTAEAVDIPTAYGQIEDLPKFPGYADCNFYNDITYSVYESDTKEVLRAQGCARITILSGEQPEITYPAGKNLCYDGKPQDLAKEGRIVLNQTEEINFRYATDNPDTSKIVWSDSVPQATNAGRYTVLYEAISTLNSGEQLVVSGRVETTIARKAVTVNWSADPIYFDGKNHVPEVSPAGFAEKDAETEDFKPYTVEGQAKDAGTHKAYFVLAPSISANYDVDKPVKDFEILSEKLPTFTAPKMVDPLVYNTEDQDLITAGTVVNGTFKYALTTKDKIPDAQDADSINSMLSELEWKTDIPKGRLPGEYVVFYKIEGDADYGDITTDENGNYLALYPTLWSKLVYDISKSSPGDTVRAVYDEDFPGKPVVVDKPITIDLNGHVISSQTADATILVNETYSLIDGESSSGSDDYVELNLIDSLGGGAVTNSKSGGAAIEVYGFLNITDTADKVRVENPDGYAVLGHPQQISYSGVDKPADFDIGVSTIAGGRFKGNISGARIKSAFADREISDDNLYSRPAEEGKTFALHAKCIRNGRQDSKAEYPYRITSSKIVMANVTIGIGTIIRFYSYLDRPDETYSFTGELGAAGSEKKTEECAIIGTDDYLGETVSYVEFHGVSPQCMTDNIQMTMTLNGVEVENLAKDGSEFNIRSYCEAISSEAEQDPLLMEVLANMLEYGAMAQKAKNYNTDNLANATDEYNGKYTEYSKPTGFDIKRGGGAIDGKLYDFTSYTLLFGDQVRLAVKVKPEYAKDSRFTFYVNGQQAYPVENGYFCSDGYYTLYGKYLSLQQLTEEVTFEMKLDGVLADSMTLSAAHYVGIADTCNRDAQLKVVERYSEFAKSAIAYENSRQNRNSSGNEENVNG